MDTKNSDVFWQAFAGEFVELLCKYETDKKMPLVIQAHLVDMDNDYYFLGDNPIEVDSAVKKRDVTFVSIIKQKDPMVEMLKEIPVPEAEEEIN